MVNKLFFISSAFFLINCISCYTFHPPQKYICETKGLGDEIVEINNSNKFEYITKGESGILEYSAGNWTREKNRIWFYGFTDANIHLLDIDTSSTESLLNQVQIKFKNPYNFTKSILIVNQKSFFNIIKDTLINLSEPIKQIQFKSFIPEPQFLSNGPTNDTLVSPVFHFGNIKYNKNVFLSIKTEIKDFVRAKFVDSFTLHRNYITRSNNKIFRIAR